MAALVPSKQALMLIDPHTGLVSEVALGAPYDSLRVVTNVTGKGDDGSDVALVWSAASPRIAFVALGVTVLVLTPYARVVAAMIYYSYVRDWRYVVITFLVFAVITVGLLVL